MEIPGTEFLPENLGAFQQIILEMIIMYCVTETTVNKSIHRKKITAIPYFNFNNTNVSSLSVLFYMEVL